MPAAGPPQPASTSILCDLRVRPSMQKLPVVVSSVLAQAGREMCRVHSSQTSHALQALTSYLKEHGLTDAKLVKIRKDFRDWQRMGGQAAVTLDAALAAQDAGECRPSHACQGWALAGLDGQLALSEQHCPNGG